MPPFRVKGLPVIAFRLQSNALTKTAMCTRHLPHATLLSCVLRPQVFRRTEILFCVVQQLSDSACSAREASDVGWCVCGSTDRIISRELEAVRRDMRCVRSSLVVRCCVNSKCHGATFFCRVHLAEQKVFCGFIKYTERCLNDEASRHCLRPGTFTA